MQICGWYAMQALPRLGHNAIKEAE